MNIANFALGFALADRSSASSDDRTKAALIAGIMPNIGMGIIGAKVLLDEAEDDGARPAATLLSPPPKTDGGTGNPAPPAPDADRATKAEQALAEAQREIKRRDEVIAAQQQQLEATNKVAAECLGVATALAENSAGSNDAGLAKKLYAQLAAIKRQIDRLINQQAATAG
jgi:hypothetical protein